MSGIGFSEFLILLMIGLVVLGPKRLPKVANQVGTWVGQARRMTRVMKRQLEEELDLDKELNISPRIAPPVYAPPRDDDTYSPRHDNPVTTVPDVESGKENNPDSSSGEDDEIASGEADSEQRRDA